MTIETSGGDQTTESSQQLEGGAPDTTQNSTDLSQQQNQDQTQQQAGQESQDQTNPGQNNDDAGNGEGEGNSSAWEGQDLDDDLKAFIGDKTPAQVAKELQNAQKLLGKKAIGIPGKDSTPEEQRAFHKARGVPEDETGYDLAPAVEKIKAVAPEGWAPDTELEGRFRKAARLSNMSNSEAQNFAEHFLGEEFKAREKFVATEVQATKQAKSLLTQHVGPDSSVFDNNFARGMKAVGLPAEGVDVFLGAYGGSAEARFGLVKAMAEIGARFGEGGPVPGNNPGGNAASMTPQQARTEMNRILADPANQEAFNNPLDPRYAEITREITRLGKIERGTK